MAKIILKNANGYMAYILQRLQFDQRIKHRFLDSIRYVGIALAVNKKKIIRSAPYPFVCSIAYPMGYLFYLIRYKRVQ